MSKQKWVTETFQTAEAGASSAFESELIPQNQLAWIRNGEIRGGKVHTRTPFRFRLQLPRGKLQGIGFFSIQGGMLIASIDGRIYRIRIGGNTAGFSYEEIELPWRNSSTQDFAWMQETVGYFIIQDGQSNAIIYDGNVARRADTDEGEVPLGRQMAYGNGRLWVAINEYELVAGDIKTRTPGSELLFTETQYLTGGGAFYFPRKLTGLGFIPATGAAGYGSLIVCSKNRTETIRADITNRDLWGTFPGFIQPVLLNTGAASHFSITEVNQDLWWRDGQGGIRSLRSAVSDESSGPGNTPQSREVARITDFEDQKRLNAVSAIQFNERLLMTASPFINEHGATSFRDIISLDFSPISSNRSKTAPSYDGEWDGLEFTRLVTGEFGGKKRAFALTLDPDGNNRLWEFDDEVNNDTYPICTGTGLTFAQSPIPMIIEYPSRDFGMPGTRKTLQRCDVYLSGVEGEVSLDVYWRCDNLHKWNQWQEEVTTCARMEDASTVYPHVWKNLAPQGRAQIKTFTIPNTVQPLTGYGNQTGFEFQVRIVVTGKARVDKMFVHAQPDSSEAFAFRDNERFAVCMEQDVTGNEIAYALNPSECVEEPEVLLDVSNYPNFTSYTSYSDNQFYYPDEDNMNASGQFPYSGIVVWTGEDGNPAARNYLTHFTSEQIDEAISSNEGIIDISDLVSDLEGPVSLYFSSGATYQDAYEIPLRADLNVGAEGMEAVPMEGADEGVLPAPYSLTYQWPEIHTFVPGGILDYADDLIGVSIADTAAASGTITLVNNMPGLPIGGEPVHEYVVEFYLFDSWTEASYVVKTNLGAISYNDAQLVVQTRIRNTGNADMDFTVNTSGANFGWNIPGPYNFTLGGGQSEYFNTTFYNPSIGEPGVYDDGEIMVSNAEAGNKTVICEVETVS